MSLWRHLESDIREDNCGRLGRAGRMWKPCLLYIHDFIFYSFIRLFIHLCFFMISILFSGRSLSQAYNFNSTILGICCFDYFFVLHYHSIFIHITIAVSVIVSIVLLVSLQLWFSRLFFIDIFISVYYWYTHYGYSFISIFS